ncbi:PREDICTED: uncharacterized protein LOC108364656 isoform X1 [Rhagoletis zephyria]|uniref:uncharacterized protein LOC108364656 isoform X1 n=1 Tax=Rhagoletis zephyria TaxID=28612 RepID=UPI0008116506|nr:PREDICTED: uncharacterized protein LOC108364656 isoform X1 [Rhagoletis zephyria]
MFVKIALICLLGVTASNAYCQDYPIRTTDPLSPQQTVRVCGTGEYEDIPKILRTLMGIEEPARHLLPPFEDSIAGNVLSKDNKPYSNEPYSQFQQEYIPEPKQISPAAPRPYPYEVINRILPKEDYLMDFHPLADRVPKQQEKLVSIADDLSTVKQTITDLEFSLSRIAKSLLQENKVEEKEKNINIVFKLDPRFELLMKGVLQLPYEKSSEEIDNPTDKELEDYVQNVIDASETEVDDTDLPDGTGEVIDNGDDDDEDDSFWFRAALLL